MSDDYNNLPTETLRAIARCVAETTDATPRGAFLDCLDDTLPPDEHWPLVRDLIRDHPEPDGFRLLAADWYDRQPGRRRMAAFIRARLADEFGSERELIRAARNATKKLYYGRRDARGIYISHQTRGFVTDLAVGWWLWTASGDLLVETQPVRRVRLGTWPDLRIADETADRTRYELTDGPPRAAVATYTVSNREARESSLRWDAIAVERMLRQVWPTVRFELPTLGSPNVFTRDGRYLGRAYEPPTRSFGIDRAVAGADISVGQLVGYGADGRVVPMSSRAAGPIGHVVSVGRGGRARVELYPGYGGPGEVELDLGVSMDAGRRAREFVRQAAEALSREQAAVREAVAVELLRRFPDARPQDMTWVEGQYGAAPRELVIPCECASDVPLRPAPLGEMLYDPLPFVRLMPDVVRRVEGGVRDEWLVRHGRCERCRRVYAAVDRVPAAATPAG